jgi:hypothetical protein
MVISLRLIEGSKEESISGRLKQGRRARGERNT